MLLVEPKAIPNALVAILENALSVSKPKDKVTLQAHVDAKKLVITIEDQGPGFGFNNVPDPTIPENIENIHGRGVYLMKHLADDVVFHGIGNRVELIFNRE